MTRLEDFVNANEEQLIQIVLNPSMPYVFDFQRFYEFDEETTMELLANPDDKIKEFSDFISSKLKTRGALDYNEPVRIANLFDLTKLRSLTQSHIGKLIMTEGIVVQASTTSLMMTNICYRCIACGEEQMVTQNTQFTVYPKKCPDSQCTNKNFDVTPTKTTFKRVQRIIIQELLDQVPPGEIPQKFRAELEESLADTVKPGESVIVIGVVDAKRKTKQDTNPMMIPFIRANNIIQESGDDKIALSEEDKKLFHELASNEEHLENITKSVAPRIRGYSIIKQAIALQQCEGVTKDLFGDQSRGQTHILLAGDPGIGKSLLIKFATSVHPRGIISSGKGASAAGLTAAVVKDEESKQWTLMAGAMVLADHGIVGADELEKMRDEDRGAMHPAMAQQKIMVNKAGINTTLNTRCSVLAAANPVGGRWLTRPIIDNLKNIPVSMLSRFDLIFVMKNDKPISEEMDTVKYVSKIHISAESTNPPYEFDDLRKFFVYARTFKPTLTEEATDKLEEYYEKMYKASIGPSTLMITIRQFEGLIRLTEASAKLHLREETTIEDAELAIKIMDTSIRQAGIDPETGEIDLGMLQTGITKSRGQRLFALVDIVRDLMKANVEENLVDESYLIEWMGDNWQMMVRDCKNLLDTACRDGLLFRPRPGMIAAAL